MKKVTRSGVAKHAMKDGRRARHEFDDPDERLPLRERRAIADARRRAAWADRAWCVWQVMRARGGVA